MRAMEENTAARKNSAPSDFPAYDRRTVAVRARLSSASASIPCATNSCCSILPVNGVGGEPRRQPKFGDEGAGLSDRSNEGRFKLVRGGRAGGIAADRSPPSTCAVHSGT